VSVNREETLIFDISLMSFVWCFSVFPALVILRGVQSAHRQVCWEVYCHRFRHKEAQHILELRQPECQIWDVIFW